LLFKFRISSFLYVYSVPFPEQNVSQEKATLTSIIKFNDYSLRTVLGKKEIRYIS